MVLKYQYERDHLSWTIGSGGPMHGVCIPHRIPRVWEQQEYVKQEEEADTRIMQASCKKSGRKERGHGRGKSQTRLN